jgi:hypothetical protein
MNRIKEKRKEKPNSITSMLSPYCPPPLPPITENISHITEIIITTKPSDLIELACVCAVVTVAVVKTAVELRAVII